MSASLLLVAHGSRDPRFADTARRVRHAVARRLPGTDVRLSFLDLDEPLVADELAEMRGRVVVVPLLLAPGYHSDIDLPEIVASTRAPGDVVITSVIGTTSLSAALADRLEQAGLADSDGLLVTAVGSTNPAAALVVRRRAVELSTRLHRPVDVVFATRLGTGETALRTAIRRLRGAGAGRIALSPYFLSAGLLTERVETALDRLAPGALVAGPLGAHPDVIEAIADRYTTAVAGSPLGGLTADHSR
ncbi:putative cobalamin (vitamin B12) biosynthesis CbiX protein [Gordonia polyisoprenivorans VH2]|uniref:Sirohydrochlorin chelatase n=2 Tax=Gordonia polyisoprenivorans TaxID=84595 RepID=A0A846WS93_9ACTN|nr:MULTISPECIES: sirohydrochlorin chelatase [Gordonia]AFA73963.1 putative cobalamin (vitamin B12) biosynthesis CbiX protein [Gordonia polyisoprenivorans VH2]MBE7194610.1 sirohydrochlorin chelatase [Gordonia polyisoprenivorans]MDF3280390.1 sirohydrochlorin chelatase [Gordonia sp. N1V]NKY03620.1 sirohydrochlorin chelatase [Gordonia polyisoprenivorans]OPX14606.1 cobalamin biosynthesis protein CbiX [Gordonia sp. i37]